MHDPLELIGVYRTRNENLFYTPVHSEFFSNDRLEISKRSYVTKSNFIVNFFQNAEGSVNKEIFLSQSKTNIFNHNWFPCNSKMSRKNIFSILKHFIVLPINEK